MMMCTTQRKRVMVREREVLVACSDKSMKVGVNVWDINTGNNFLHIPSCASLPFGLLCLRNRYLVASQLNRHGSVGGGSIVIWSLNKPLKPLVNYTMEAIGPLSCTKDGLYLVGGGFSGNVYIWDVTSGELLKSWIAHNKPLNCMLFSDDNSLLISGSDDGMICVWSMISLLDVEESRSLPSLLHCLLGHMSTITGLLTLPGSCSSVLVSSSLDGTCKVWDIISGKLLQSQVYSLPITSISLDHGHEFLFYGIVNGTIIVNKLNIGLEEGPITFGQSFELKGHSGSITALTSCQAGLISGSEDCTICIWNVINRTIIRRFNLQKGKVTNLVVVMRSSMLSKSNHKKVSNQYIVSPLHKCHEPYNSFKGATTLVSLCGLYKENQSSIDLRSATLLRHHTSYSQGQKADMSMAMSTQMKVETNIEHRMWAIEMTKHIMRINKQLKSQLLGMIQSRLCCSNIDNLQKTSIKKLKFESLVQEDESEKP
ncbi:PREDICTED: protein ROOT INITIATION DEFECTIVE 3-like [Lupinus angustifolius]|uniref:protein ROOT INITIATION DEFECTIVE 3-like n=1 Tax=Lupinus angustifolius TaxID=3871 RepID=UPI00092F1ADC|nr:PREDICTED: protein ROOT INITIATION DEFECTIVE 3-like [Lupinus angustifolius]